MQSAIRNPQSAIEYEDGCMQTPFSLSIFFPCYNDAGTIASMVVTADAVAQELTDEYEVIVIDDGSTDSSREILKALQQRYNRLRLVFHEQNKGYGGALRSGFAHATKDWVFYTDGDAQYDVRELKKLVALIRDDADTHRPVDVVQGFKIKRHDPFHRVVIGKLYQYTMKLLFGLKIRDVDCDFRLMRRTIFERVALESNSGIICLEMVKKIQDAGFRFVEVGVHHYFRISGTSQFFNFGRIFKVGIGVLKLWGELVLLKKAA